MHQTFRPTRLTLSGSSAAVRILCERVHPSRFELLPELAMLSPEELQALRELAPHRVLASNKCEWLVDYYLGRGDAAKAESVAREAADTGSATGLFVMAKLLERLGRNREAEEHYRHIFERYDGARSLTGFYYRQARVAGNAIYEARFRDTLALALPDGLEPFDRSALPPEPTDGVVVRKENDNTKRYGIKWGHVIVGLDGFRVRDLRAYHVIRALSHSPRMKLVVWRGARYDDIEVELWDRRFRIDLEDLAPEE